MPTKYYHNFYRVNRSLAIRRCCQRSLCTLLIPFSRSDFPAGLPQSYGCRYVHCAHLPANTRSVKAQTRITLVQPEYLNKETLRDSHTIINLLTLTLLIPYIYGAPSKARNLTSCIHRRDFLLGILLLEPWISLIYAWKTNKYINYSLSLLIMYGSSYMFRHNIAIFRELS
jgi:hypothetical protein